MATSDELVDIERWFVRRGVPHFIDDYAAGTDIWTQALPLMIAAYVLGGFRALDIYSWSLAKNLLASAMIIAVLLVGWAIANLVLRRPLFSHPTEVGNAELAAFVIGPSVPSLIFTQYGDALAAFATGVGVLVVVYFATSYAVVPMLHWALERCVTQLRLMVNHRARPAAAAAVHHVLVRQRRRLGGRRPAGWPGVLDDACDLLRTRRAVRALTRATADARPGVVPVVVRGRRDPRRHAGPSLPIPTEGDPEPHPLRLRERVNVGLLMLFSQALQITLVVIVLTVFFVVFGFLAMSESTTAQWTSLPDMRIDASWHLGERTLVLTEPLLRIAGFLGAFSGMYFTVVLATDATYRDEFAEDVRPEVHRLFAVRLAYDWALGRSDRRALG